MIPNYWRRTRPWRAPTWPPDERPRQYRISGRRWPRMKTVACTINLQPHTRRGASLASPNRLSWNIRRFSAPLQLRTRLQNGTWRSRHPKGQSVSPLFRGLVDFEKLVGRNVSQHLNCATWPANLYPPNLLHLASSEVDTPRTGGSVPYGRGHVVGLIAQPDLGADSVTVASGTTQFQDEPVVDIWADVLPKLRRFPERADDNVHFSVVIKIYKGAAPVGTRESKARFRRNILKCAVPKIGEEAVGLLVVRGLE